MSVQLSLLPQSFDGNFTSFTVQPNNLINDSVNWNTIPTAVTTQFDMGTSVSLALIYAAQYAIDHFSAGSSNILVGQWYVFGQSSTTVSKDFGIPTNYLRIKPPAVEYAGVFQRVSILAPGANYTVSLPDMYVDGTDQFVLQIHAYNAATLAPITPVTTPQTLSGNNYHTETITFNAPSGGPDVIVAIYGATAGNSTLLVENMFVNLTTDYVTGSINELSSGEVIVDLYEDESIPLTFSVDNFKNAAEKTQSYSKAFKLPGTTRNNRIFDNLYEVTRTTSNTITFNPHKKTQARLKENGFIIFEGYLKVIDVQDKEGEISYNVNMYSNPIALADILKERTFADLDLTELAHDYNKTQIKNSWNDNAAAGSAISWTNAGTSGFRTDYQTVKYPFVDWNHQFLIAPSTSTGPNPGMPQLNVLQDAFRPWISIKYLLDRIFQALPDYEYSCAIWESTDFANLYMDFNWGADVDIPTFNESGTAKNDWECRPFSGNAPVDTSMQKTPPNEYSPNCASKSNYYPTIVGHQITAAWGSTAGSEGSEWVATYDGQYFAFSFNFQTWSPYYQIIGGVVTTFYNDILMEYQWWHEPSGGSPTPITSITNTTFANSTAQQVVFYHNSWNTTNAGITVSAGDKFYCTAKTLTTPASGTVKFKYARVWVSTMINDIVDDTLLSGARGDTNQWDFVKGIMNMYNLLAIPNSENSNIIEFKTYNELYPADGQGQSLKDRNIQQNWTDKVDVSQIKLQPLEVKEKTILKYEEDDDDYTFNVYKRDVQGHLYGSKVYESGYGNISLLQGENVISAKPFAATIMKPLMSQFPTFVVPSIYAYEDGQSEGFDNAPRICYNSGLYDMTSDGYTYYIPAQNGLASENQHRYIRFSHLSELPVDFINNDTRDINFGECQLIPPPNICSPVADNLYNMYWSRYLHELYHPDTREMTLKVNLSPADIEMFEFTNQIYIKNRAFRVNKIDYKPGDLSTVEFILIP
jgi:hypothetical protein